MLAVATALDRILVTEDKGFGALVLRGAECRGLILLRTTPTSEAEAGIVAARVIEATARATGAIVTLTVSNIRVHPLS